MIMLAIGKLIFVSRKKDKKVSGRFDRFSTAVSKITGSPGAFVGAIIIVVVWVAVGPFFHFSNTWYNMVSGGIAIITFLMLFVFQQAQNKDTLALQLKLNELIAATKGASNRVLNIEDMTEEELKVLKKFYLKLGAFSEKEENSGAAHSVDEVGIHEVFKEVE